MQVCLKNALNRIDSNCMCVNALPTIIIIINNGSGRHNQLRLIVVDLMPAIVCACVCVDISLVAQEFVNYR